MPHLPAVEINGGSVTLKVPVNEVNAKGKVLQTLFEKGRREIETYPEVEDRLAQKQSDIKTRPEAKRYTIESYSTVEKADAYIYLVEIYGEDEDEIFEFRPKDGKCSIKVYFALEEENKEVHDLMDERRWPHTVKRLFSEGKL
jgi:hypothetical protein